ncbi:MAG: hypothetical protein ACRC23_01950 [Aeromonas jandaei]
MSILEIKLKAKNDVYKNKLENLVMENIEAVLNGDIDEAKNINAPFSMVEAILCKKGYSREDIETNGWQVDFWVEFTKPGERTISVSGGMWYGTIESIKYAN